MPSQYLNFDDYAKNDRQYFLRSLKGELHRTQSKIKFQDGSTYHVTKSGSRYWNLNDNSHRENGPAVVFQQYDGNTYEGYYLHNVRFDNREEHELGVQRLNFLREQTDNTLESTIQTIVEKTNWENRSKIWRTVLTGSDNSTELLSELTKLAKQYAKLAKQSDDFVNRFSKS
jgi:hypothetical protein